MLNNADRDATRPPLRILAVSALWQGANDYAFVRAFRRAGHSVMVVSDDQFFPPWTSLPLRAVRRALERRIADEFNAALLAAAAQFKPDLLFVFKGRLVAAPTLRSLGEAGCVRIQFYPDTGFAAHSALLWQAIQNYDWVFSTKPGHPEQLKIECGVEAASFLPHAYDPETHFPPQVTAKDRDQYECDVSFIGNISPKKDRIVTELMQRMPGLDFRIWGPVGWRSAHGATAAAYQGGPVFGREYAKALALSRINLGLLFEGNVDAAAPDVLTSRTFHIAASGGFMLHERTKEAQRLFEEGKECAYFSDAEELVQKVRYYLAHEQERRAMAQAARRRCLTSGYSVDDRAAAVIAKYFEIKRGRAQEAVEGLRRSGQDSTARDAGFSNPR